MTTPAMEACLNEVGKYVRPPKEKTLFPLGGRAYYENPALDLGLLSATGCRAWLQRPLPPGVSEMPMAAAPTAEIPTM
jgi:hypothetical protein